MEDIVSLLVKRHMNLVVETILSFLDHNSLQSCEFVSKTWYLVIRNGKLWKRLYGRVSQRKPLLQNLMARRELEAKHDTENDEFLYKRLFYAQQTLVQNWSSGKYKTSLKALGEVSVSIFTMDARRILYVLRTSPSVPSSIMVWNGWTMESEHFLVGHQEWITDMQICGDLIFCSYYDGTILVWDQKTKEVVQQFQDQEVVDWVVIHASHGLLITCTSILSGLTDQDISVTIRRIHSPTEMAIERVYESFRKRFDPDHHNNYSCQEELDVDMVLDFPLDQMHLVDEGAYITVEPMYSDTQPISLEQLDVGNSETPATVLEKEPEENNVEYVQGENSSVNNDYFEGDEMDAGVINDEHDDEAYQDSEFPAASGGADERRSLDDTSSGIDDWNEMNTYNE
ncbi:F-box and WD repeat domain-containing 11-B-like [Daphnia magna]|uniref:F-box and WD repeat domain-containing 11-B-like n=1 Tax=Daphnia magna TaxID=35525 RepID=UPI001E1BCA78|nr:F-box and WD repeat domain-containing 11-B-like [Daphnia magna]